MPNCVQFIRDGQPVPLNDLDVVACRLFGDLPDQKWYNTAFLSLQETVALEGSTLAEIAASPTPSWTHEDFWNDVRLLADEFRQMGLTTRAWAER